MATFINKTTFEIHRSASTPSHPAEDWWRNPIEPACEVKYWKNANGTLAEMTQAEKDSIDSIALQKANEDMVIGIVTAGKDKREGNINEIAGKVIRWLLDTGYTIDLEVAKDEARAFLATYLTNTQLYIGGGDEQLLITDVTNDTAFTWMDTTMPAYNGSDIRTEMIAILDTV
jgi:hypothetical protein